MSRGAVAGDALLHPVALASLALLIFNDHVLKFRAPGLLSGKLSDVAILVVGPLLLQGIVEVFLARSGRPWGPSGRAALVACAVTGIAFALEKTLSPATELYRVTWGAMRWPLDALVAFARGLHAPARVPVAAVTELTPELVQEGMAREFVRRVQDLRKSADLDVADRIDLFVEASAGLRSALEAHRDYITAETLTSKLVFGNPPAEASVVEDSFDGETVKAGLVKK